ncbi:coiled-coil domain-containing protein 169-like isoform X1 [Tubulanus polymorphus]|uniref:coiled-coil domain-containing protein 169-like isoform X1 n=1 Tax=Tubulanus polymorphus TaxID=672921 RepID=UPI003DA39C57
MAADEMVAEQELERLRSEVIQERQMKEMLDQSIGELQATVNELERRVDSIDDEGNEWKTRYEMQLEINQQLQKQIFLLQDKIEQAKKASKDINSKAYREQFSHLDFSDAAKEEIAYFVEKVTPQTIKMMEREKQSLQSQLRDIDWRIDQESKAYHRANEERKKYNVEISATKHQVSEIHQKTKTAIEDDVPKSVNSRFYFSQIFRNIPPDQRVIDPRKGPIKKTAAVKSLPKISSNASSRRSSYKD